MSLCDHVSWVGFVEGEAGPHLSYDWRLARVIGELHKPYEQYPHVIFFMGTKHKDAALRQLCKGNYRRTNNRGAINLRADSNSLGSTYPRLYADCDPGRCTLHPAFNTPQTCHRQEIFPVRWPTSPTEPYDLVIARLLFLFTDVICIFAEDVGGLEATRTLLLKWAAIGSASTLPPRVRPRIIVVTGGERSKSMTELMLAEDDFLFQMFDFGSAPLFSSFSNIGISRLPSMELSADARYLQLWADINTELRETRQARLTDRARFSAVHLNAFFEDALLRHFTTDALAPFSFILWSRRSNPISGSLVSHLSNFFTEGCRIHAPYDALASYVASAILMDAYPPSMHVFCPRFVFKTLYRTAVHRALSAAYSDTFAERQCQNIEDHMSLLFDSMVSNAQPSARIHRYNLKHDKRLWRQLESSSCSTCFGCLRRSSQHPMPSCGHLICDTCVEIDWAGVIGAESEYIGRECPVCAEPTAMKVKVKPRTAGARLISIDGGGTCGMIPIQILSSMQMLLGPDLPIEDLFEFNIGTSSGGHTALDLGKRKRRIEDIKEDYPHFIKEFLKQQKDKSRNRFFYVFKTIAWDGLYDAESLENIHRAYFGTLRMFDASSTMVSGAKVAVPACTIEDGTPNLFTNYNAETPLGHDRAGKHPFVWQAARATSAAPFFFPSVTIDDEIGSFMDGGMRPQYNNPVNLGLSEIRRLWPSIKRPDVVISLGTGTQRGPGSPKMSTFRNILTDGWLLRGCRSYWALFDGELTWLELVNRLDREEREKYVRLNVCFPGPRPALNNADCMGVLSRLVQEQVVPQKSRQAVVLLLTSCFFFELDAVPQFHCGLFRCVGSIRCRGPARTVVRTLLSLQSAPEERLDFYKDEINLGFSLSEDNICTDCRRYCLPVRFFVRHLQELFTLKIRFDGCQYTLSGFPNTSEFFTEEQGLDSSFGTAHHDRPLYIRCGRCDSKVKGKIEGGRI
ncbi:predicted protein [Histoplasma mississippiense (nom. inval.)]|uniref:predicted protein n=1 Tax=Ajellomyces capsulatus (strain NAm1 / WU24) TaxID=2059318 RepID=UPI000157D4DA|nr:predicted protein [Histoplasma mississippiense (nom. inval.)]EDN05103.1 predicted protein [Histoplasma mississippiense (nom. inval.)]